MVNWNQEHNSNMYRLGSRLSMEIHCPVRLMPYNVFECRCGVIFPLYLLESGNWELIKRKHAEESARIKEE